MGRAADLLNLSIIVYRSRYDIDYCFSKAGAVSAVGLVCFHL